MTDRALASRGPRSRPGRGRLVTQPQLGLSGQHVALSAIVLIAVVVRLGLTRGVAGAPERVVWGDEPFYLWLGRNLLSGRGFEFVGHPDVHHGPLLPIMAGLMGLLTGDLALASEILYIILGAALVIPVYALGCEAYDRRVGLAAAALTAVFPALTASILHWGTMTEPLYLLLVYLGLWAGLVVLRPSWPLEVGELSPLWQRDHEHQDPTWAYALSGLAFGLAYLTRPEAIGYFVVVGFILLALAALSGRLGERRLWLMTLVYAAGFALAFVPYATYVRVHTGAWMVSEKVGVAYLTGIGLATGDAAAFDRATWGLDSTGLETFFFSSESYNVSMVQLIIADPGTFTQILYLNARRLVRVFVDRTLFPLVLLPLPFVGLFVRGWTRRRLLVELYLILSALPILGFVLFFIQARYLVPFVPIMILWSARGLASISDWLMGTWAALQGQEELEPAEGGRRWRQFHMPRRGRGLTSAAPVVLTMCLLLAAHPHVLRAVTTVGSFRPAHREVGEYLVSQLSRDALLMSRYPAIAFHADVQWVPTPNAPWPEVLRYARHKGVTHWAVDERELSYRPQFAGLVRGEGIPPELSLVYEDDSEGLRLVVYRLGPEGDGP